MGFDARRKGQLGSFWSTTAARAKNKIRFHVQCDKCYKYVCLSFCMY